MDKEKYLQQIGVPDLQLVMKTSTLHKCIRKPKGSRSAHNLKREIIECIPEQIEAPVFVIRDVERNSFVIIGSERDHNSNPLLIVIQINNVIYGKKVNEVKSIYGKEHLQEYLNKQSIDNIYIMDKEKAKILSPSTEFRLLRPPINPDYK